MKIVKCTKRSFFYVILLSMTILVINCNKYSFVETKNNQSVYLDQEKGKVIFVDETNRIVDSISLNLTVQDIQSIKENKAIVFEPKIFGVKDIGTRSKYFLSLNIRFYNNKLLYLTTIKPYNSGTRRIANTINILLGDSNGFVLEEFSPRGLVITIEDDEEVGLDTFGSIPITINNYMEIDNWNPQWSE